MNESIIDKRIIKTIRFANSSDTHLKFACISSSSVVGKYDGVTQEIATLTHRSVSTVENWAHAHRLYKETRSNGNRKTARLLWRELPASHWWMAYDIQRAGYDALYYLMFAFQNRVSGRGMMGEFDKDRNAGNAPLVFKRAKIVMFGLASELIQKHAGQLNEAQKIALLSVQEAFA